MSLIRSTCSAVAALAAVVWLDAARPIAQSNAPAEDFNAIAMVNDNFTSGAGRVEMRINRWSTNAERDQLVKALVDKGPDELLTRLQKTRAVGTIKTPDS